MRQLAATRTDLADGGPIGPHTIRRFTLTNGIRLIVQENHASPSVVLRGHLWAGSVSEPADRLGLADERAFGEWRFAQ